LRPGSNSRVVDRHPSGGPVTLVIDDDFGEVRDLDHGLVTGGAAHETWTISAHDPLTAHGKTRWVQTLSRDEWSVTTETFTEMASDAKRFHLKGRIRACEGEQIVFERSFEEDIPRGFI
jgi:hypothetical protein